MVQWWISLAAPIPSPEQWTNTSHFVPEDRYKGVVSGQITTLIFWVVTVKACAFWATRSFRYTTSSSVCIPALRCCSPPPPPTVSTHVVTKYGV